MRGGDDRVSRTARSEDARSFYQQRLALMCQVGFPVSATFLVGYILASTGAGEGVLSILREPSRWFHIAATLIFGALWWTLKRHKLRYEVLDLIDTAAILFVSLLLKPHGSSTTSGRRGVHSPRRRASSP